MSAHTARSATTTAALLLTLSLTCTGCAILPAALLASPAPAENTTPSSPSAQPRSPETVTACRNAQQAVDAAASQFSEQFRTGIANAADDLTQQRMPDLRFLTVDNDLVAALQHTVHDPEIAAALSAVGSELTAFQEIDPPQNLIEIPGYLGQLRTQFDTFRATVSAFTALCQNPAPTQETPQPAQ